MKRLFEISSEEKQRILEMHESATKKNYLSEQETQPTKPLKVDSIKSAIYTTCNPQKQSTWTYTKKDIDAKPELKGLNWDTIFKESSMGSKFGVQNGLIWEFNQEIFNASLRNYYRFYYLDNGGIIKRFATIEYSCNGNNWAIGGYEKPIMQTDRANLFPAPVMMALTSGSLTQENVKIPDDIIVKLVNLIKSQPNLNPTVASAIKTSTEGNLKPYGYFTEDIVKEIKGRELYKALGGV
jgi:hypothetical protein